MYSFPDIVTAHYSDNLTLCQAAFLFCFAPGCRWSLVLSVASNKLKIFIWLLLD